MIQAVLWDIDGTLLDSEPHHFAALAAVCAAHGAVLEPEEQERLLGLSMGEVFALITATRPLPLALDAFKNACNAFYVARVDAVPFRPGGYERVDDLALRGVPQACVSNSGRKVVEANFARLGHPGLAFALSRDDVVDGKPAPEPYLKAAARLGVAPEACLVVEDSPIGARSAKAAGMFTIAWPQVPGLTFDAADRVVDSLDVLDWDRLLAGA
ncbi:HAD family hydrolase [Arenibaculum pallidiluteum]|uniref:HAD family hydrolase n=1 Tax=Arenibaculum pallidiluteum TaxID=2812559 RepID=UPI001A974C8C|nr:HAD family phosphatase [Arenibaculum pallidiluteum]